MIDYSFLVMRCLKRALNRDIEKEPECIWGMRNTVEIAEWVGCSVRQARETLYRLFDADLIDCYDERPLIWRLAAAEPDEPEDVPTDDDEQVSIAA